MHFNLLVSKRNCDRLSSGVEGSKGCSRCAAGADGLSMLLASNLKEGRLGLQRQLGLIQDLQSIDAMRILHTRKCCIRLSLMYSDSNELL